MGNIYDVDYKICLVCNSPCNNERNDICSNCLIDFVPVNNICTECNEGLIVNDNLCLKCEYNKKKCEKCNKYSRDKITQICSICEKNCHYCEKGMSKEISIDVCDICMKGFKIIICKNCGSYNYGKVVDVCINCEKICDICKKRKISIDLEYCDYCFIEKKEEWDYYIKNNCELTAERRDIYNQMRYEKYNNQTLSKIKEYCLLLKDIKKESQEIELLKQKEKWSIINHNLFPKYFKESVLLLLVIARRMNKNYTKGFVLLSKFIIYKIIEYI